MSIRQIQTRNFLEFIISSYLAYGKKPTDSEIYQALNHYFSNQTAGQPLRLEENLFRRHPLSNVDDVNDFMASIHVNLATLFQQVDEHVSQNMLLTTALLAQLRTIRVQRKTLENKVDDLLLSLYNIDGYFYSVSDHFYDTSLIDFTYTDSFVDVESDIVSIPANSSKTKLLNIDGLTKPSVTMSTRKDSTSQVAFTEETSFNDAVDGLTNTAWYMKARVPEPSDGVTARITIPVGTRSSETKVTQLTFIPHGVKPVQCSVRKKLRDDAQTSTVEPFSNFVKTSAEKMTFINEQQDTGITALMLELTKAAPDYMEDNIDGTRSGIYLFGMKEIMISEQAYDAMSTFVTKPLSMTAALVDDALIDAVSLTVEDSIPVNTSIKYYIAPDNPNALELSDFEWQQVSPVDGTSSDSKKVVKLGGATKKQTYIRLTPRTPIDLTLFPINESTQDLNIKNPTDAFFPDFDVYRIAKITEPFISNTISLEEGINTTRIYHTTLSTENINNTFSFWKSKFENPVNYVSTYGEVDIGNEFFYGADIGENARSVYVETFLYADDDLPVVLKEIVKSNPNSQLWDVKAYLNGREIAAMPVGLNKVVAPLKFNRGKNSIVFAVNIPASSGASLSPYIGSVAFDVREYGTIKLSDMTFVDLYKFGDDGYRDSTNTSPNKWFTIYNNEIVTRTKTTNNYRLRYMTESGNAPLAIRLRAELKRFEDDNTTSPILDSYRIRFSYTGTE